MAELNIGAAIGRFQVPEPHAGHRHLFEHISKNNDRVVVLLGCNPTLDGYTAENPFTFSQRQHVLTEAFPGVIVLPLFDRPTDAEWAGQIDGLLRQSFPHGKITLYGGRASFIGAYAGKFPVEPVTFLPSIGASGTNLRADIKELYTRDALIGQCYALQRQWPSAKPAVDVALTRAKLEGAEIPIQIRDTQTLVPSYEIFLIQRADTGEWGFPGGFVDTTDDSYTSAAARELHEEVGLYAASRLKTIDNIRVDDWRYRGVRDKIFTTLFHGEYSFGNVVPNPDEVQDWMWASKDKAKQMVCKAHQPLLELLLTWKP